MAVLEFDIYAEDAPNGSLLGTITDEDATDLEFEVHMRKAGTGHITIGVDHAKADLVRPDRYVKCRVPVIDADPIFGFWLREGSIDLASANERGALRLRMGGPGPRDVLRLARLLEGTHAPVPPASEERGSSTIPGLWRWIAQHRGAIAARAMEEGINQVIGTLLPPMDGVTFDWDRTNDSDGVPWSDPIEILEQKVGIDIDSFMRMLEEAGGFMLEAEPNLLFHAWQTFPSRDLSASVIFQAAGVNPNVASEMARTLDSTNRWNATILETLTDGLYHEHSSGTGVRAHIGYINASIDTSDYAEMIAERAMEASEAGINTVAVEVDPTQFLPGKSGTSGDFWVGDLVGLKTQDGTGDWDYNGEPQLVTGIRVGIRIATDDSTTDRATRSLQITALLNDDQVTSSGISGIAVPGITHSHPETLCDPTIEGTEDEEIVHLHFPDTNGETVNVYPSGTGLWPANAPLGWQNAPGSDGITGYIAWGFASRPNAASPNIPATPGVEYRYDFDTYGSGWVDVNFIEADADLIVTHQLSEHTDGNSWVPRTATHTAPANTAYMTISVRGAGGYDHFRITALTGTEGSNPDAGISTKAARCDHTHPLSEHDHDTEYSQVGHGHTSPVIIHPVIDHGSMGATEEFDFTDGSDHEGVLDTDLTITLTGSVDEQAAWLTLKLALDGTGGHSLTLPAEVVNGSDVEAAFDQTANAVNVLTLFTYDGGTTWYGFLAGSGSAAAALTVEDEGTPLATAAETLDFVGAGVTVTGAGAEKTITIPGGSSASDTHAWKPLLDDDGAIVTDGAGDPVMGYAPL